MDASSIIRVGSNYILRISAASQDHVLGCITRKVTPPKDGMTLALASKMIWLFGCGVGGRNGRDYSVGNRS